MREPFFCARGLGPEQRQARNIPEVLRVQCPEGGPMRQRARGYGKVQFPPPWSTQPSIQIGGEICLLRSERDRQGTGEERFLRFDLFREAGTAEPLVQHQRAQEDPFSTVNPMSELGCRPFGSREAVDQN
jgi:hypothetical protein